MPIALATAPTLMGLAAADFTTPAGVSPSRGQSSGYKVGPASP
jgi:hypothetical protein